MFASEVLKKKSTLFQGLKKFQPPLFSPQNIHPHPHFPDSSRRQVLNDHSLT